MEFNSPSALNEPSLSANGLNSLTYHYCLSSSLKAPTSQIAGLVLKALKIIYQIDKSFSKSVEFNVKRLRLRVSSLLKGFVLALIFSVFLQASLASANGDPTNLDQTNFYSAISGDLAGNYILVGPIEISKVVHTTDDGITIDSAPTGSTVFGTFTGTFTGLFDGVISTISGLTRPLFNIVSGDVSNLNLVSGTGEFGVIGNSALANDLGNGGTIGNVSFVGDVTGEHQVGGLVGVNNGAIINSYAAGEVTGYSVVGGLVGRNNNGSITSSSATVAVTGGNYVGGLVGSSTGTIDYSIAVGTVTGTNSVGGLVGENAGAITNSSATVAVTGNNNVGGLVGYSYPSGTITNSYSAGEAVGNDNVGGLVGNSSASIINSSATGVVMGHNNVGGLVGWDSNGTVTNSYSAGEAVGNDNVGGLVGNSSASIINSYATGVVIGNDNVGGLVGYLVDDEEDIDTISNSYATGDVIGVGVVGSLVGFTDLSIIIDNSSGYFASTINGEPVVDPYLRVEPLPYILDIINTPLGEDFPPAFAVNASINDGRPYLTSLELSYDVVEGDTEETPSYSLRSYYTQAAKRLDKALTSFGFKSNFSSHPNLGFKALEQNQSNSPAVIQLFEVSEYQNSNILLNKEDGLQLSISSYYKEAVEIWTQGLNGEYLYLGLVEFDKDGKAILPTLKFDTASTYQLLMIKAADKLSQKPNLERKIGEININVI